MLRTSQCGTASAVVWEGVGATRPLVCHGYVGASRHARSPPMIDAHATIVAERSSSEQRLSAHIRVLCSERKFTTKNTKNSVSTDFVLFVVQSTAHRACRGCDQAREGRLGSPPDDEPSTAHPIERDTSEVEAKHFSRTTRDTTIQSSTAGDRSRTPPTT